MLHVEVAGQIKAAALEFHHPLTHGILVAYKFQDPLDARHIFLVPNCCLNGIALLGGDARSLFGRHVFTSHYRGSLPLDQH